MLGHDTGPRKPAGQLARQIGLYAATALTIGDIIGSGIFRSPQSIALHLGGTPLIMAAWVAGGLLAICGALVMAELAVANPKSGGLYVMLRGNLGDGAGFVYGCAHLWVMKPTLIASIASVFALYFCQVLRLPPAAEFGAGAGAIALLTFVNWLGIRPGSRTQSVLTTLKLVGLAALCVAAFALPSASGTAAGISAPVVSIGTIPLRSFAMAMIAILFTYDGWADATYVAGEVVNPARTLPIAIVWGTWVVIGTYLLVNAAYLHVLGVTGVAAHPAVGAEVMRSVAGEWGAGALAVLVAVSTLGATNGSIITGARVTYAMAADGMLWRPLAHVDARTGAPTLALLAQAAAACVWLWAARSFEDVSSWFVTSMWMFYSLAPIALFVRRRRERLGVASPGSYRTPLYPVTPILMILTTLLIVAGDLYNSGWRAAAGLALAALGVPVYYLFKRTS